MKSEYFNGKYNEHIFNLQVPVSTRFLTSEYSDWNYLEANLKKYPFLSCPKYLTTAETKLPK